jgi:hypothetical protein
MARGQSGRPPTNFESGASTNSATGGARLSVNGPIPFAASHRYIGAGGGSSRAVERPARANGDAWHGFFLNQNCD